MELALYISGGLLILFGIIAAGTDWTGGEAAHGMEILVDFIVFFLPGLLLLGLGATIRSKTK